MGIGVKGCVKVPSPQTESRRHKDERVSIKKCENQSAEKLRVKETQLRRRRESRGSLSLSDTLSRGARLSTVDLDVTSTYDDSHTSRI